VQAALASSTGLASVQSTGLAAQHGLATTHGALGVVVGVACVGGVVGMLLPGRMMLLATAVIALSSAAIFANGLVGFLSANHFRHEWDNLVNGLSNGGLASTLRGASSSITKNALLASAGPALAGVVGLGAGLRSLGAATRQLQSLR
jgi:hypothetical protein